METIDKLAQENVYAIFKNGKSITFSDFGKAKTLESADFFIRRKLRSYEELPKFGNKYYYYDFEIFDNTEHPLFPKKENFQILNISSFYNTAKFPMHRSSIIYKILEDESRLIEFEILGNPFISTIELVYSTLDFIKHSGGFEAFKVINENKNILLRGDKLIHDSSSKFS